MAENMTGNSTPPAVQGEDKENKIRQGLQDHSAETEQFDHEDRAEKKPAVDQDHQEKSPEGLQEHGESARKGPQDHRKTPQDHRKNHPTDSRKDHGSSGKEEGAEKEGFRKKTWKEIAEARREQLKEVTDRLEAGVREYMATDVQFKKVLDTMAKFHHYSSRNVMLITMQMPSATHVASYGNWQKKFSRQVKKGQKGISIIMPAPYKKKTEREMTDPRTGRPVLDADGVPKMEEVEVTIPRFKVAKVFDISQTSGEPLPELDVPELTGNAENYRLFMEALTAVSPVPIRFDDISGSAKGFYDSRAKEIVVKDGMSESQTMKTAVHEVSHARLHDRDRMAAQGVMKDQETREIEAESIAYTVLSYYNLDTSGYSIPYLASWSGGRDTKTLQESMDTIRITASQIIDEVDAFMKERLRELNADRFTIYQLRDDLPDSRDYRFESLDRLMAHGGSVLPENYREIYHEELKPDVSLEDLYERFNQDKLPENYKGHSLSVSDIIVVRRAGEEHAHYVDSFGFKEVPEFLSKNMEQEKEQEAIRENAHESEEKNARENERDSAQEGIRTDMQENTKASEPGIPQTDTQEFTPENNSPWQEVEKTANKEDGRENEPASKQAAESFFAAECMEFPVMGEYHTGLTFAQAVDAYQNIPEDRMNAGKGIGFILQDGSDYAGSISLVIAGQVKEDEINKVDYYRDHPDVQAAVSQAKEHFPAQAPEMQRDSTDRAGNDRDIHVPDSHIPDSHVKEKETPAETSPQPAATDRAAAAGRETGGRKESVLAALRKHQEQVREGSKENPERARTEQKKKGELSL